MTTVGNNWANRRWTFRRRGADRRGWQIGAALAVYLVTLALSTIGLVIVRGNDRAEIAMLLVTWGLAGLFRFTVLRSWVYRRSGGGRG